MKIQLVTALFMLQGLAIFGAYAHSGKTTTSSFNEINSKEEAILAHYLQEGNHQFATNVSMALWNYERGLRLAPYNSALRSNRDLALKECSKDTRLNNVGYISSWTSTFQNIETVNTVCNFTLVLSAGLLVFIFYRKSGIRFKWLCKSVFFTSLLGLSITAIVYHFQKVTPYAVCIRNLKVHSGPSYEAKSLFNIEKEYYVEVVAQYGTWVEIKNFKNQLGWVKKENLLIINE